MMVPTNENLMFLEVSEWLKKMEPFDGKAGGGRMIESFILGSNDGITGKGGEDD